MNHHHWLFQIGYHIQTWWPHLDKLSLSLFGGTTILGTVAVTTSSWIALFFTVGLGATGMIYNIVKTRIAISKERDRKRQLEEGHVEVGTVEEEED